MPDTAQRAITDDGAFRVVAIRTTETVRGAIASQAARGETAKLFGELVTGSILIRQTMAPDLRVQAILQGDDRASRMIADANPDASTRGLVQLSAGAKKAGAKIVSDLETKNYGEDYGTNRSYELEDPEGHRWWISQRL